MTINVYQLQMFTLILGCRKEELTHSGCLNYLPECLNNPETSRHWYASAVTQQRLLYDALRNAGEWVSLFARPASRGLYKEGLRRFIKHEQIQMSGTQIS